jgi:hypothetical protein
MNRKGFLFFCEKMEAFNWKDCLFVSAVCFFFGELLQMPWVLYELNH